MRYLRAQGESTLLFLEGRWVEDVVDEVEDAVDGHLVGQRDGGGVDEEAGAALVHREQVARPAPQPTPRPRRKVPARIGPCQECASPAPVG